MPIYTCSVLCVCVYVCVCVCVCTVSMRSLIISSSEDLAVEEEQEEDEHQFQAAGKVGAKKQRKMEEKQARRAQREVRSEPREDARILLNCFSHNTQWLRPKPCCIAALSFKGVFGGALAAHKRDREDIRVKEIM